VLTVADVMTRDVETVTPETSLRTLIELLAERHVGGVPVVSGAQVVGVVSTTDVLSFVASREKEPPGEDDEEDAVAARVIEEEGEPAASYFDADWVGSDDPLDRHVVAEAMTSPAQSVPSTADVREAADVMCRAGIHRVVVLDGDHLAGIVTTSDLARAGAGRRLSAPDSFIEIELRGWP
jgi:CBS domain-containing protein